MSGIGDFLLLRRHQYRSSAVEISCYQQEQVLSLLAFVRDHAPFYKRLYEGREVHSLSDFHQLPGISKQIMMENFDELNTCGLKLAEVMEYAVEKEKNRDYLGYFKDEYVIGLSSGTSGNKGIYVTPKEMTKRLPFVFLARSGIPLRMLPFRILFLLRVFSQGFADINAPFVHLKYLGTMTPIPEIIAALKEGRINILMAPPSLIRLLLPHLDEIGTSLKLLVTYAEVLEEEEKQRFEKAFGTKVIEIYQASEGQIGSACKCGRLHINEDLVYVELYDAAGNPVTEPDATASRMFVTNLVNRAQPLIRYEMNDLVMLGEPCPCGSSFRVIRKVLGRHDDVLWLRDEKGRLQHVFPDLVSRWIITASDNVREFQVRQTGEGSLNLTVDLSLDDEEARAAAREALSRRLSDEMARFDLHPDIDIRFETICLPADMGKYRRFIQKTGGAAHEI